MTFIKKVTINTANATGSAFGRLRTAGEGNRLDAEFIYNKHVDLFDEINNNGSVTLNGNTRDLTLALSDAVNGSYAEMRSHPVPYTPGNGQLIEITGVLDYANIASGVAEIFLRTNITGSIATQTLTQPNWINLKTGINWQYSHIVSIDFQSLRVGTIRYNLIQNGIAVQIGQINNDNIRNSGYWQNASLPAYWRIYNSSGNTYMEMGYGNDENAVGIRYVIAANASATMKAICVTVKSEGGVSLADLSGLPRSINNGVTTKTVSTTLVPILSIRPKSLFNTYDNLKIAIPRSFTIQASNPVSVCVVHSATLTGASWSDVNGESMMEYDVSATTITNGHCVFRDYVTTVANNRADNKAGFLAKTVLWNRKGSETGILTIAAVRTGGTDADCLSTLNWEEI